jgi:ribosomal protein L20
MPRSVNHVASKAKRTRILKLTKGYYGARKNVWTVAKNTWEKGLTYAYRDRRNKKRTFRALWIQRINAAARLDGITDVRNFGAIARTCECAGVDAIVIPSKGGASISADAIKTSAGALLSIPVCREENLGNALKFLVASGIKLVAASEKATKNYTQAILSEPIAFIMGAEDEGVSPDHLRLCDEMVSIPMSGSIASLNVSVATGVLLYEAVRQRSIVDAVIG